MSLSDYPSLSIGKLKFNLDGEFPVREIGARWGRAQGSVREPLSRHAIDLPMSGPMSRRSLGAWLSSRSCGAERIAWVEQAAVGRICQCVERHVCSVAPTALLLAQVNHSLPTGSTYWPFLLWSGRLVQLLTRLSHRPLPLPLPSSVPFSVPCSSTLSI